MRKRLVLFAAGLAVGLLIALCAHATDLLAPLSFQAANGLAVLACCIVWWVGSVFPEFVTALIMVVLFVVLCAVPTETAFSAFSSSIWWLLVAAYSLGYGMQRTGLMARMARAILRVFPHTFRMQVAGLIAAGTLVGPFIPSLSAKATILAPLSLSISDSLGYERKGPQAEGMFLAMLTGLRTVGPAVVSASILGYGLLAVLPDEVVAQFDMLHWFLAMLPWFMIVTVVNYIAIVGLYGPHHVDRKGRGAVRRKAPPVSVPSSEDSAASGAGAVPADDRVPFTSAERRMAVIIAACIVCWVAEPVLGVPSHIVAIGAMVLMLVCDVVPAKELFGKLAWGSLIFMGCVLGLADVFAYLGINEWIVASCEPLIASLAGNAYLFIGGICLITIALRFVIVSEMAFLNIFMAFMVPLSLSLGINPWVVGISVYAVVNPWFAPYQNIIYLTAYYATGGEMVRQSTMAKYCAIYLAICIAGLMASIPYWQGLGLI